ncbi:MAG TPA: branched-chain amino acid ABC transporter permease, partial [Actinotalea sp.]|nr:branched-chain amino acid ABC transporter permease [Actinotalea sp.]
MTDRGRRARRLLAGLAGALLGLLVLGVPAAAATTTSCTPSPDTGCVAGTIRTSTGEPAVGVALTVSGQSEDVTAVTGADGRWAAAVTTPGEYEVLVDAATLPVGETLRDPANNPRTVTVALGSTTAALFPLGTP